MKKKKGPTLETNLLALLLERECLVHVEPIRVHDRLLARVEAQSFAGLLCKRRKSERVARVLTQAMPTACASYVGGKVLPTP
jgi:hypothetical protein